MPTRYEDGDAEPENIVGALVRAGDEETAAEVETLYRANESRGEDLADAWYAGGIEAVRRLARSWAEA